MGVRIIGIYCYWSWAQCVADVYSFCKMHFSPIEFNECLNETIHQCHEHADCVDTREEFYCKCKEGFKGDGKQCSGECCFNSVNAWLKNYMKTDHLFSFPQLKSSSRIKVIYVLENWLQIKVYVLHIRLTFFCKKIVQT